MDEWTRVRGTVVAGYRVASGPSQDYPYGALERQRPIFQSKGLDLSGYFNGTLNIDIRPATFEVIKPELTFRQVEWTDLHPPEDFSFSGCVVEYSGQQYRGWLYYPHPETKIRNFQNPSLLEVIAETILGMKYGAEVDVWLKPAEIRIQGEAGS